MCTGNNKTLTKKLKKETEKKHLKEEGALRRARRNGTIKKSLMDEGRKQKSEKALRTDEGAKIRTD